MKTNMTTFAKSNTIINHRSFVRIRTIIIFVVCMKFIAPNITNLTGVVISAENFLPPLFIFWIVSLCYSFVNWYTIIPVRIIFATYPIHRMIFTFLPIKYILSITPTAPRWRYFGNKLVATHNSRISTFAITKPKSTSSLRFADIFYDSKTIVSLAFAINKILFCQSAFMAYCFFYCSTILDFSPIFAFRTLNLNQQWGCLRKMIDRNCYWSSKFLKIISLRFQMSIISWRPRSFNVLSNNNGFCHA